MGFFKKHILPHSKAALSGGLSLASKKERSKWRKSSKSLRSKFGLTGHKLKKMLGRSSLVASPAATSAATEGYHHYARTLSQLTGGV